MGSLRDLRKDPSRIPKPIKKTSQVFPESGPYQSPSYVPHSSIGISFDNFLGGYIFSVDSVNVQSSSVPFMASANGIRTHYAPTIPTPIFYIKDFADPSVVQSLWAWTTGSSGAYKKDGMVRFYDASGNVAKKWRIYGCFPTKSEMRDSYSGGLELTSEIQCDRFDVI